MKEAMLVAADSLFDDFKNKTEILGAINMLQLSARAATRRIELIASNLEAKLANDVETCEFLSIQLDESTDAVDTVQLAISVKMVFDDFSTKEEFLKILPLTVRTQGKDVFSLFKKFAIENKLPLQKLSSITTDGARAMTGLDLDMDNGHHVIIVLPLLPVDMQLEILYFSKNMYVYVTWGIEVNGQMSRSGSQSDARVTLPGENYPDFFTHTTREQPSATLRQLKGLE
ncbi:uncharacterized protein TNCV_4185191 [Trichonephila clavipes]|nr:uncharacterized protein TNCV_4185191 [Trichonephila clavipes]